MLDIKFIRDNVDLVKMAVQKRHLEFDVDELLRIDAKRRELQTQVEEQRAKQNEVSKRISAAASPEEKQRMIEEMQTLKRELQQQEEELTEVKKQWQRMMLEVPNIPDMEVPEGEDETANRELRRVGELPDFSFPVRDHMDLLVANGWVDFERGVKTHGFRGYFLKGDGALITQAIWNYARDFYLNKGFTYFIPPTIVNKEYLYGTGHLPGGEEDMYATQDEQYLAGTSEISMMAYHADETVRKEELPKKYLAFSPCYRREAGSYGKDVKGLLRVHEFYKIEQVVLCEADHELSVKYHEELNRNMEEFIESLGLPYRQSILSSGDLKASQVKGYDTELWVPSQGTYREIGTAAYYHDFQARRFNIRYHDGETRRYVHSLNATAIPTPRILVALAENYQQADGSIAIPEVLKPYMPQTTSGHSSEGNSGVKTS